MNDLTAHDPLGLDAGPVALGLRDDVSPGSTPESSRISHNHKVHHHHKRMEPVVLEPRGTKSGHQCAGSIVWSPLGKIDTLTVSNLVPSLLLPSSMCTLPKYELHYFLRVFFPATTPFLV